MRGSRTPKDKILTGELLMEVCPKKNFKKLFFFLWDIQPCRLSAALWIHLVLSGPKFAYS